MVLVNIAPTKPIDISRIAERVREHDRDEIWAMAMQTPDAAMQYGLKYSEVIKTGFIDDQPVAMWGVVPLSMVPSIGAPWMVGTKDLEQHAFTFLRRCREPLMELFKGYDTLENYVDVRNTMTIKWLKFMGFNLDKPQPYGPFELPFHRFWRTADV